MSVVCRLLFALVGASLFATEVSAWQAQAPASAQSPIGFELKYLPFRLQTDESPARNAPESVAGGIAVFDYNGDGRPDIFFANGSDLSVMGKSDPKYLDRLYRNNGDGTFTDVTEQAGIAGKGFDIGVAAGDFDNDGHPDLFIAGVHGNALYHNNGDGTFSDVTAGSGLANAMDPEYGPIWSITAAWVDVNNDGLLDLFVVNYLQWHYESSSRCVVDGAPQYCHPRYYKGMPNQLFLNQGKGKFKDVSKEWGIRDNVGKGMGVGVADFDLDNKPDLFVTNDAEYAFLFHNLGDKFEQVSFQTNTAVPDDGALVSGMGLDFREMSGNGYPDIVYVCLNKETFPVLENAGTGTFNDITGSSGMTRHSMKMAGFGAALYDFDNDGRKDLFVSRGHVAAIQPPGESVRQPNTVFRGLANKEWEPLTQEAGFSDDTAARHRGCAFGNFNGDGRMDIVVTSMDQNAELWMNRSPDSGHWLDFALRGVKSNRDGIGAKIKLATKSRTQYNHQTSSVCYASSSLGPVHFGLGAETVATQVVITWPSGIVQELHNVAADRVVSVTEPLQTPQ